MDSFNEILKRLYLLHVNKFTWKFYGQYKS